MVLVAVGKVLADQTVQGADADADRPTPGALGADRRRPRETLEQWTRGRTTARARALRTRTILRAATGQSNTVTACELRLTKATVGKWRARFVREGRQGLLDEPRPGVPRQISDAHVEQVITRTLESTPSDATHWSNRSMATATGLMQSAISRICHAFALQSPYIVQGLRRAGFRGVWL